MTRSMYFSTKAIILKLPIIVQKFHKCYQWVRSIIFTLDVPSNLFLIISKMLNNSKTIVSYLDQASQIGSDIFLAFGDDGRGSEDVVLGGSLHFGRNTIPYVGFDDLHEYMRQGLGSGVSGRGEPLVTKRRS